MKKVRAHFEAEIYEVFDYDTNLLINQAVDYSELLELCEDEGYDLMGVTGMDDDDDNDEVPTRKTNVDLVSDFMNFGSPMNQMFVIDALSKHAHYIVDNEEGVLKAMEGSFVDGPSWVRCAKDFLKKSEEFYK